MKIKTKHIVNHFNFKYPFFIAEEWDKVGLHFGSLDSNVDVVVVALDLGVDVFNFAVNNKANLIIIHHPFIFNDDLKQDISEAPYKKEILNRLESTNIGVLTLHTNYDKTKKRTASRIASNLGFNPISSTSKYGHLFLQKINKSKLEKILFDNFSLKIKDTNINTRKLYNKWGILPGAGSPEDIVDLHQQGAEFIIVSDVKWSTWQTALNDNIKIVEVSHAIEDVFTFDIAHQIQDKWKNIKVFKKNILNLK